MSTRKPESPHVVVGDVLVLGNFPRRKYVVLSEGKAQRHFYCEGGSPWFGEGTPCDRNDEDCSKCSRWVSLDVAQEMTIARLNSKGELTPSGYEKRGEGFSFDPKYGGKVIGRMELSTKRVDKTVTTTTTKIVPVKLKTCHTVMVGSFVS